MFVHLRIFPCVVWQTFTEGFHQQRLCSNSVSKVRKSNLSISITVHLSVKYKTVQYSRIVGHKLHINIITSMSSHNAQSSWNNVLQVIT